MKEDINSQLLKDKIRVSRYQIQLKILGTLKEEELLGLRSVDRAIKKYTELLNGVS